MSKSHKNTPATIRFIEMRKKLIIPFKDTKIEKKIQNYLQSLNISFIPHRYMSNIEHSYQADIFIPSLNLVIEADGTYWHNYPYGREIDLVRSKELREQGYKVLRLWENEINVMELNEFDNLLGKFGGK